VLEEAVGSCGLSRSYKCRIVEKLGAAIVQRGDKAKALAEWHGSCGICSWRANESE
jgi:hypothetical protein